MNAGKDFKLVLMERVKEADRHGLLLEYLVEMMDSVLGSGKGLKEEEETSVEDKILYFRLALDEAWDKTGLLDIQNAERAN